MEIHLLWISRLILTLRVSSCAQKYHESTERLQPKLVLRVRLDTSRTTEIQNNLPTAIYLSPHGGVHSARAGCAVSGFILAIGIAQRVILGSFSMIRRPSEAEVFVGEHRLVKSAKRILPGYGLAIVDDGSVIGKEIHPAFEAARARLFGEIEIGLAQLFFQSGRLQGDTGCRVRSSDSGVCLGRRGRN